MVCFVLAVVAFGREFLISITTWERQGESPARRVV